MLDLVGRPSLAQAEQPSGTELVHMLLSYEILAFLNGGFTLLTFMIRDKTPACLYFGLPDKSKSPKEYAAIQSRMDRVQVAITCRMH